MVFVSCEMRAIFLDADFVGTLVMEFYRKRPDIFGENTEAKRKKHGALPLSPTHTNPLHESATTWMRISGERGAEPSLECRGSRARVHVWRNA